MKNPRFKKGDLVRVVDDRYKVGIVTRDPFRFGVGDRWAYEVRLLISSPQLFEDELEPADPREDPREHDQGKQEREVDRLIAWLAQIKDDLSDCHEGDECVWDGGTGCTACLVQAAIGAALDGEEPRMIFAFAREG